MVSTETEKKAVCKQPCLPELSVFGAQLLLFTCHGSFVFF